MLVVFTILSGWLRAAPVSRATRLVISFALCLALAFPVTARELLLTGPPWPPYLDESDPRKGFATEIVTAALKAAGHDAITVRLEPWRRVMWNARNRSADGLIGIWHAREREDLVAFSEPYFLSPIAALLPAGSDLTPLGPGDLDGLRVAYREGARFGAAFDETDVLEKLPVGTTANVIFMVAQGRIDAGIEDRLVAGAFIEATPSVKNRVRQSAPLLTQPLYFGVVRGKPHSDELLADFNRGLDIIRLDGEYERILQAYGLADSPSPWHVPEQPIE